MPLHTEALKAVRYAAALSRTWRAGSPAVDPVAHVRAAAERREAAFLAMMHRSIYGHPASPYLALLRAAGIEEGDVAALVDREGIEATLTRLCEAGVYLTLDEFKGHTPLRRGSVALETTAHSFDNPQSGGHVPGQSGGTRSAGGRGGLTRFSLDLDDLRDELPSRALHLRAHGLEGWPYAIWLPAPPALGGLRVLIQNEGLGLSLAGWFSQTRPLRGAGGSAPLTAITLGEAALLGHGAHWPVHVPMDRADRVARWLAERTAGGRRIQLYTTVNAAVRIAHAAEGLGLDISGHAMRTSSEPLTAVKAAVLARQGLRVCSVYGLLEAGMLGFSCGNPEHVDEMHVLSHRYALIQRERRYPGLDAPIGELLITVYSPANAKILLNVETGDYATLCERTCGCPLEAAGLTRRLHTIRSYEKLTSAGVTFMGSSLLEVLEEVLPARFGGSAASYQFVEREVGGETVVSLVIDPEVGPLDETAVVEYTLEELARRTRAGGAQASLWRDGRLLRVERAQPYTTSAAKIQALHVQHGS